MAKPGCVSWTWRPPGSALSFHYPRARVTFAGSPAAARPSSVTAEARCHTEPKRGQLRFRESRSAELRAGLGAQA